jgi:hypothetical protein
VSAKKTVRLDFALVKAIGLVKGRLVDENSKEGVPGVRVFLNDREFAYTDDQGEFRFEKLPLGVYEVLVDTGTLPFGYKIRSEAVDTVVLAKDHAEATDVVFACYRPVKTLKF